MDRSLHLVLDAGNFFCLAVDANRVLKHNINMNHGEPRMT